MVPDGVSSASVSTGSVVKLGCPAQTANVLFGAKPDSLNWLSPGGGSAPGSTSAGRLLDAGALIRQHLLSTGFVAPAARLTCDNTSTTGTGCERQPRGDPSDPIGAAAPLDAAGGLVCLSAPQAYKAGWARPLHEIRGGVYDIIDDMYSVPSMHTSSAAFVRIVLDQAGVSSSSRSKRERALYISYRAAQPAAGYDSGLPTALSGRVWVHQYDEIPDARPADQAAPPVLLAVLDAAPPPPPPLQQQLQRQGQDPDQGQTPEPAVFILPGAFGEGASLHIRVTAKNSTAATVVLCRSTLTKEADESCYDGFDNDW
ncbi:hypothetical protein HXX76_001828 [Chlamydomonas incerta]|uniref:Peptidase M11 gametolysin domain-containing protein n=1 Tax=Chlamydomonas incerta TaxID=51695 RepID=A0A835W9P9_CHLIN|nr:hypothetical protein HXX76_001828 [Chlamydomonas incerta]|eukprot:KAG2443474.1 hypothetical protein HXX76_001828 [Chlamydomonas incerta]